MDYRPPATAPTIGLKTSTPVIRTPSGRASKRHVQSSAVRCSSRVQWHRASFVIAVPGGKRPRQRPRTIHFDRARPQRLSPLGLTEVPSGKRHRIVDYNDQLLFATGVLLADLCIASLDQ